MVKEPTSVAGGTLKQIVEEAVWYLLNSVNNGISLQEYDGSFYIAKPSSHVERSKPLLISQVSTPLPWSTSWVLGKMITWQIRRGLLPSTWLHARLGDVEAARCHH